MRNQCLVLRIRDMIDAAAFRTCRLRSAMPMVYRLEANVAIFGNVLRSKYESACRCCKVVVAETP